MLPRFSRVITLNTMAKGPRDLTTYENQATYTPTSTLAKTIQPKFLQLTLEANDCRLVKCAMPDVAILRLNVATQLIDG